MDNLKYILESLLFVSSAPVSMDRIKLAVPEADSRMIRSALEALAREYEVRGGGFSLHHVAGGYQLRTRPEFAQWIKRLHQSQPVRLSKPALETLAIIAYRQPILRSDVEYIRGVDSGGVLKMLMEKNLIRVLGRDKEKPGRPIIYCTTKRFLEVFDLKDLTELPTLKELEELGLAKKKGLAASEEETESALPHTTGFAEFQNRKNHAPLESPNIGAADDFVSAYNGEEEDPESGEPPTQALEFAADHDRFPGGGEDEGESDMDDHEDGGAAGLDGPSLEDDDEEDWDSPGD